ncbi:LysR family transcriptional regulator [Marinibaculum pumilum]|uniref:LysR family transcriptional regulator n=1 Tax=Marinibaculum pumilum TaxID=1766165 RepID=A0ABV7KVU6_9PROT
MRGWNLEQLQTFAEVIELGSFSAAAQRAGMSQPAVSQQVRQLERLLEVRLIERVGRQAQATPAGAVLLRHVRQIQEEIAGAQQALAPHRDGVLGRVRIGTGATACIYLLPPVLRGLRARMPGLEITVRTGNTADILRLLESNDLDLALATMPIPGRALQVTPVHEDPLVAVFPAGAAPAGRPVTPAVLADQPLLLYEAGGNTRQIIDRWFARGGRSPKPVMELGSVEAIKQLVGAGLGWAVLPRLAVAVPDPAAGLGAAPLSPPLSRSLGLVLRRDKLLTRGLRETIAALQGAAA